MYARLYALVPPFPQPVCPTEEVKWSNQYGRRKISSIATEQRQLIWSIWPLEFIWVKKLVGFIVHWLNVKDRVILVMTLLLAIIHLYRDKLAYCWLRNNKWFKFRLGGDRRSTIGNTTAVSILGTCTQSRNNSQRFASFYYSDFDQSNN